MEPVTDGTATEELPERLIWLARGSHRANSGQACAMEAASWLAGEPWSDHPRSVHKVIAAVARLVNDVVDDAERQQLWPLILASLDTARPRGFLLTQRLGRCAWKALVRSRGEDPRQVWECVLTEHARLTGHSPTTVRSGHFESLTEHLTVGTQGITREEHIPRGQGKDGIEYGCAALEQSWANAHWV